MFTAVITEIITCDIYMDIYIEWEKILTQQFHMQYFQNILRCKSHTNHDKFELPLEFIEL